MRVKRKCFAVLLIIVLVVQDPFCTRARTLGQSGNYLSEIGENILLEEFVQKKEITSFEQFQIQYYLNGGENAFENPCLYTKEELPIQLSSPKRSGYNFAGWFTDSKFTKKITEIKEDEIRNYKLYAKWTRCIDGYYNVQMYSYQNAPSVNRFDKKLKNCKYKFRTDITIPGMPLTREQDVTENKITDASQCPQGICLTDEYMFVSAYSTERKDCLGCIYVFDRESGNYLITLGLREKSHLGGLSFDGESLWVCHSNSKTIERIPYAFVRQIVSAGTQRVVDCSALFEEYHVLNAPSCITCYDGKIWVATHTKIFNSVVVAYEVGKNGLRQKESYRIPEKVQGISFDEKGKVYISTSYGRKNSSYIKVYASAERMDKKPSKPMAKVEMPPCSEELALEDGELYVLFESAGERYFEGTDGKGTSVSPIDEILVLSKKSIFQ